MSVQFARLLVFLYVILYYEGRVWSQSSRTGGSISSSSTPSRVSQQQRGARGTSGGAARSGVTATAPGARTSTAIGSTAPKALHSAASQPNASNGSNASGGLGGQPQSGTSGSSPPVKTNSKPSSSSPSSNPSQDSSQTQSSLSSGQKKYNKKDLVDLDTKSASSTDKFEYKKDDKIATFTTKGSYVFKSVKDGQELWKTDKTNEYSNKVEVAERFSGKFDLTIHLVDGKKKLFLKEDINQLWKQIDLTKVNPESLNINYEHESHYYTNKLIGETRTFEAKDGFAFKLVGTKSRSGQIEIWKTDQATEYSKKVVVEGSNKVTIHSGEGNNAKVKVFTKGSDGNWKEDTAIGAQPVKSGGSATPPSTTIPKTAKSSPTSANTQSRTSQKSTTTSSTSATIPKTATSSTTPLAKPGQTSTTTPSRTGQTSGAPSIPASPKSQNPAGSQPQGSSSPTQRSSSVQSRSSPATTVVDPKSQAQKSSTSQAQPKESLTSQKQSQSIKSQSATSATPSITSCGGASDRQAPSAPKSKPTPNSNDSDPKSQSSDAKRKSVSTNRTIELDINKSGSDEFDYEKKEKIAIYTPKDGTNFKLVKEGNTKLWQATDPSNYPSKVEVDLISNISKAVTIHLGENKTKLFLKEGGKQPWKEIDTTKVNPRQVNIRYQDSSFFYTNVLDNNVRTFEAKKGFAFNRINEYVDRKMVEIWKTDKSDEYCTKISVTDYPVDEVTDITFTLANKTKKKFIKVKDTPKGCQCRCSFCCFITCGLSGLCCKSQVLTWKELDLNKPIPILINVSSKYENYEFSKRTEGVNQIFEAREGYAFKHVIKATCSVWKTSDEKNYSTKVIKEKNDKIIIYMGKGDKATPKEFVNVKLARENFIEKGWKTKI